MIETQPLEVIDFSEGITDYFIDGRPTQAQTLDNLFLNPNKKPVTRWGSQLYTDAQIPLGTFRIHKIGILDEIPLAFAQKRVYRQDTPTSYAEIQGPSGDALFTEGTANSIATDTEWQGHLFLTNEDFSSPQKIYRDENGDFQARNAGLPVFPSGTSITPPAGAGFSYLYAFNLRYDYKVGDVQFIDRGPVFFYTPAIEGGELGANSSTITLPVSLTANENWDAANIEIEISRTTNGGTNYFVVTKVPLGTINYVDSTTDDALADLEALYTTGGIFSNDTPPKAKYVHVVNDTAYYANIQDGSDEESYKVLQSISGDPDSVPASFFSSTEQRIKGLSSIFDRPIVLCEQYIYRIDNIISAAGVGSMDLRRIDDRAGCASQNSIVQTHQGLFWAGESGFYWTDGFKVAKISNNLNETYRSFVLNEERQKRIVGTYDPSNERIIWSVCKEDGANEPDICMVLDLKFGIRPESTFTTMSGETFFKPTAVKAFGENLYRGDTRGYVLTHNKKIFTDPKIDETQSISDWVTRTIIHDYKSCFLDFGSKFLRKFVPRLLVSAANTTNLNLAIASSNDNNRVQGTLKPIEYTNNITWGDDLPIWGDPKALWNYQGIIEEWRRFPARGLRCQYKQVQLTNAQVDILGSDLLGDVTVNDSLLTATLGGTFQWLEDMVDYYLAFSNDGFVEEYLVTTRTPTTVVFTDPNGKVPPSGQYQFILRGKPRGEVLELNGYVIHWAYLSKSHAPFSSGST